MLSCVDEEAFVPPVCARTADLDTCIIYMIYPQRCRFNKEQEALLGVQDKVLAGLRSVSSWLTPDLHRPVRAALLPLVTQPGFIKKVAWGFNTFKISHINAARVELLSLILNRCSDQKGGYCSIELS